MTSTIRLTISNITSKLIILMTNEALKLVQLEQDYGLIIPMYIIYIFMDPSI
jgi:hypothetical protein